jgi:hypothetical protein
VEIPLALLNIIDIPPAYLVLYGWLTKICGFEAVEINQRELSVLSGLPVKKISAGIAFLKNREFIFVDHPRKSKIRVEVAEIPDHVYQKLRDLMANLEVMFKVKNNNDAILKLKKTG